MTSFYSQFLKTLYYMFTYLLERMGFVYLVCVRLRLLGRALSTTKRTYINSKRHLSSAGCWTFQNFVFVSDVSNAYRIGACTHFSVKAVQCLICLVGFCNHTIRPHHLENIHLYSLKATSFHFHNVKQEATKIVTESNHSECRMHNEATVLLSK